MIDILSVSDIKLKYKDILSEIEKYNYWDMGIDELEINDYFKEVKISYFNETKVVFKFLNCFKVSSELCLDYDDDGYTELPPCFLQDIDINEINLEGKEFYKVLIDAHPLNLEIWCKDINVISEI